MLNYTHRNPLALKVVGTMIARNGNEFEGPLKTLIEKVIAGEKFALPKDCADDEEACNYLKAAVSASFLYI